MSFSIEIAQSEDRCWMFRITEDEMWQGGFDTYWEAREAAVIELRNTAVNQIRNIVESELTS
jgi:hypothetical protein